jgi:hypothetical protein
MRLFYEIKPLQAIENPYLDAEALANTPTVGSLEQHDSTLLRAAQHPRGLLS